MKKYFNVIVIFLVLACQQKSTKLVDLYDFPKSLKEVSGMITLQDSDLMACIEDSGNKNEVYFLNSKGKIKNTLEISNVKNTDWEDVTKDQEGNLYIGDFGNNDNVRKDLAIYKINKDQLAKSETTTSSIITFSYPEQKDFPPKKKKLFFDVEGFIVFQNNFYLFTKNRSSNFDGTAYIYKVPTAAGNYQAQKVGEFKSGPDYHNYVITSAAISPDQKKIALLTHSKIILFENFKGDDFLSGKRTEIDLQHFSQKEAICFKDNSTVYIADEKVKKSGGKVYEFKIQSQEQN
ncbi:hypothetical protein FFWV33_09795 [Flavobacterium faecale]|uniref:SdiA-regulated family protein n=1 Tax=Flavobacterium faecale TaxID=1355330 RepID=A0A2S1LDH2_9FLAO|nr:hypothetical protein [Flavobacterium faecale]AWG21805.1 hypothetical protein FFWV33_09795 [Flavobacterium faecale]